MREPAERSLQLFSSSVCVVFVWAHHVNGRCNVLILRAQNVLQMWFVYHCTPACPVVQSVVARVASRVVADCASAVSLPGCNIPTRQLRQQERRVWMATCAQCNVCMSCNLTMLNGGCELSRRGPGGGGPQECC